MMLPRRSSSDTASRLGGNQPAAFEVRVDNIIPVFACAVQSLFADGDTSIGNHHIRDANLICHNIESLGNAGFLADIHWYDMNAI